ncbi:MAG: ParB/RepB/Spo0J family partition protein [Kiritimatiellae bacterium]|nr:ParB/RepB/Spo0J family partition protein [Kiritimatiellia bacterium]
MAKPTARKSAKPVPRVKLSDAARKPFRPGGLGRGLESLIDRDATRNIAPSRAAAAAVPSAPRPEGGPAAPRGGRAVENVPVALVRPNPRQPRRSFDEDALRELADSIRAHGIIQPLVCRKRDGFWELVGGERRLRAATLAGLSEVPVVEVEAGDRESAELALVENLQREDLNAIEEAEGYKALAEEFKLTQSDIAERVGKARASVANSLRLLELPDEVKGMVGEGLLSAGHAKVLLSVQDAAERVELARQCLGEGLAVRALERRIRRRAEAAVRRPAPVSDVPDGYLRTLVDKIRSRVAAPVRLFPTVTYANGRHGRGRLEIDFFDNDDLSRLLEILGVDVNE